MDYVLIGKIINTFGIRGELKVNSYTDFAKERFKKGSTVYVGEKHLPFTVKGYREHKGFLLVSFKDHEDINLVEKYILFSNVKYKFPTKSAALYELSNVVVLTPPNVATPLHMNSSSYDT